MNKTIWTALFVAACGGQVESTTEPAPAPNPQTTPAKVEEETALSLPAAPSKLSCESIKTIAPVAKFDIEKINGSIVDIKPVDVYVEERTRPDPADATKQIHSFAISFTETPHECGARDALLMPRSMNELRVQVDGDLAEKTYVGGDANELSFEFEAGDRCITDEEFEKQGGFAGTAAVSSSAKGTVTITKRTATTIEGTVDVANEYGEIVKARFSSPVCKSTWQRAEKTVCCAR